MNKNNLKNTEINQESKKIKFLKYLAEDSYCRIGLDNTFIIFKSINNIFYLIYSDKNNSIISYNLISNKKINEIKKAHEYYIISIRYYCDTLNKRDLILSMSCFDNNIKLWNIHNYECLLSIKNYNNGCDPLSCFLNDNNQIYIISINNTTNYKIDIMNFNGELIKEIIDNNNKRTYIIDTYFDNKNSKNYILTGNDANVKSYDYNENKIYKIYSDNDKRGHHSLIIYNENDVEKLIESSFDGNIRIWNFHSGLLLNKIKVNNGLIASWIYSICLLDNNYLIIGCYKGIIRVIDINKQTTIKELNYHQYPVICITKLHLPNIGTIVVSQGFEEDGINLYIYE